MMQMGYRIHYLNSDQQKKQPKSNRFCLTTLFFALYLLLVSFFWPEGNRYLKNLLLPGNADATIQAIEVFVQELNCGEKIQDAAKDFYQQFISYD